MNSLFFGIIIGLFLYFASERFIRVAISAFKQRKVDTVKREEEKLQMMVDKVMGEYEKKR